MSAVIQAVQPDLKSELSNWRDRLEATAKASPDSFELTGLLREVSAAIERLTQKESYGVCQVCHDLIGQATMTSDPIAKTCLNCFTPEQISELEDDLDRAWSIQGELLPKQNLKFNGWEVAYHYEPAGPVSGDYCDLISTDAGDLYFMIGDVAGKGVAASLLMTRLHAIFRSLIGTESSVSELVERVNHLFADTTMRPYYATLVCGKASASGDVEVCNAGHCPPLHLTQRDVCAIPATGLPVGMFCQEKYEVTRIHLDKGDRLILYTDGVSETRDLNDDEYGEARLKSALGRNRELSATALVNQLVDDVRVFSASSRRSDDLTVMAIEMVGH
jgi:sigma-B regulation protein RsbU (phosphoserine phosphatase)